MRKKKREEKELTADRWKRGGIVAALFAALAVFAVMLQLEKNTLTKYERGDIFVAVKEIPKGQMVTAENREQYFVRKQLDRSCIPETALCSPEQAEGLAAAFDIAAGTLLTAEMFEGLDEILGEMENPVIAGFKADDLYQVVGGVLRAGDRIHIYRIADEEESETEQPLAAAGSFAGEYSPEAEKLSEDGEIWYETESGAGEKEEARRTTGKRALLIWENVYVQDVFDQSGNRIQSGDTETGAQRVNVYLDKADVEAFYAELAAGTLRVVKDCK